MDYIKAQLARIQQQLGGLTASQKMLTLALVAIVVTWVTWWALYAGTAELTPVLDQSFSGDDISRVTARIASRGIQYKVQGDKVLVPTERKFEVLADLGYAQLLPRDTKTGFDEIVKQMSPWDPQAKQAVMWNRAKELTLAQIIRGFPGADVTNAVVVIDPTDVRHVGNSIKPSATVSITTRGSGRNVRQLVDAARDVVAGSVAAISRENVMVVVDGVTQRPREIGSLSGAGSDSEMIELTQMWERKYADSIQSVLSYINGLMVGVTVELNTTSSQLTRKTYDSNVISKPAEEETTNEETIAAAPPAGEPGMGANVSVSIPTGTAAGGQGASTSSEKNRITYQHFPSVTEEKSAKPAGTATVVAAVVRVPQSYFEGIYRKRNPSASERIDESLLQPLVDAEMPKIRDAVKRCTPLKDDQAITVEMYPDLMRAVVEAAAPATAATGVTMLLGGHVKEIAVGALAVISLFMVSMMVRKGTPAPAVVEPDPVPPPHLAREEDVAGEVGEGSPALDAMELDEDAIKTKQMLEQVSTLVDENPDAAANLVKRWLNRS